jgi:hypothetical protein
MFPILTEKEPIHQTRFLDTPKEDEWDKEWQKSKESHFRNQYPEWWHQNQEQLLSSSCICTVAALGQHFRR